MTPNNFSSCSIVTTECVGAFRGLRQLRISLIIAVTLVGNVLVGAGVSTPAHANDAGLPDNDLSELTSTASAEEDLRAAASFMSTPRIFGQVKHDSLLSARPQLWSLGVNVQYQWLVEGKPVPRGTKSTYRVKLSDIGKKISVQVTGHRAGSKTMTVTSAATVKAQKGSLSRTPKPKIFGSARVGKKLIAHAGQWDKGVRFTYQWYVNGTPIRNATRQTITLRSKDYGKRFSVTVTGKKPGFELAQIESGHTKTVRKRK